ncbi:hypothetical protein JTB14_013806 [Gonioctena quinquepunctata]|nr:hypothetical protein JTB14_013806 [Gonioctena quinquepunctata]
MNDDELILRRKRQNADRARAYRKRKKDLDAMPSTSTIQSAEPVSENMVPTKLSHQKQLNAERCRRYRQKCKRLKSGANLNQGTSDSDTITSRELIVNPDEFQNSSNHPQQFFNDESSPQAPENTTGDANTSTPAGVKKFHLYRGFIKPHTLFTQERANMSSDHECSVTDIVKHEEELLAPRNHFDVINDIKREIKEEPVETKWLFENGVCDESRQEEEHDGKFNEPVPSNCGENPRESKHSLTDFWENTDFNTEGSDYIFAANQETMDVLVRWRDGTKNIVSSSELKITSRILKVGSKVKMLYKKKWYSGVVIDMEENVAAEWSSEDDVPLTNFSNVLKNSKTLQHNNIGFRKEISFNDLKNNKDTTNQIGISSAGAETMMEREPIPEIEITDDFVVLCCY